MVYSVRLKLFNCFTIEYWIKCIYAMKSKRLTNIFYVKMLMRWHKIKMSHMYIFQFRKDHKSPKIRHFIDFRLQTLLPNQMSSKAKRISAKWWQ